MVIKNLNRECSLTYDKQLLNAFLNKCSIAGKIRCLTQVFETLIFSDFVYKKQRTWEPRSLIGGGEIHSEL